MTLKRYLNLMGILTTICWLAWVLILFFISPNKTGLIGFVLFYFSLFLAILGTAAILGFIIRVRLSQGPVFKQIEVAFRQGIWISLLIVGLLLLQGLSLLKWWNGVLLVLFLIFLEFFFLSSRKRYKI